MQEKGWKKVIKAEPGQYWSGGFGVMPSFHPWPLNIDKACVFSSEEKDGRWLCYIGPPLEEPPKYVDLPKDGDPVMVRPFEGWWWLRAYATGNFTPDGKICVYYLRRSKWASCGEVETWPEWRRPEPHEYP